MLMCLTDGSSPASLPQHGSGANQASPFDKKHGQHSSTSDEIDKSFDKGQFEYIIVSKTSVKLNLVCSLLFILSLIMVFLITLKNYK